MAQKQINIIQNLQDLNTTDIEICSTEIFAKFFKYSKNNFFYAVFTYIKDDFFSLFAKTDFDYTQINYKILPCALRRASKGKNFYQKNITN